jgi:hypothetical protein
MTSISAMPSGSSNPNPAHQVPDGTGYFMLTLCRLAAPVSIRPPQSPRLRRFTFFMTRALEPDGSERLSLHMGYFETLADAERWLEAVRRSYPDAFATIRPFEYSQPGNSDMPALPPAASQQAHTQSNDPIPLEDESLTDTQVLRILETRRPTAVQDDVDERNCDQIALLRPEDTGTRRALKEAVAQGAPVSFAVQLHWSAQPIDLSGVPSLAIFKPHTLYATESRREGRCCYFLRLGFFTDPISAKQVAVQVRSTFASAAVVPVVEREVTRAREAGRSTAVIPYLGAQRVGSRIDDAPRRLSGGAQAVGQTPEPLAKRGTRTDDDSLSDSGVRHLRIEVQEQLSGRWRIVRLGAAASNMVHVDS